MSEQSQEVRRQVDPIFKQVLTEELTPLTKTLQTEVEVSRLPRTIDALVTLATEEELQRVRTATPFFYFLKYNQVEFKGREDPLTVAGCHLINGRTQLYLGEQDVSLQEMTVTIICAGKPRTVLTHAKTFQPFHRMEAGYYKNKAHPSVYLIVINELPIVPKHYALLLFASSDRKFRQFLKNVIADGNMHYLRYAYELRPQMTREVLTMAGISTSISRKDLQFMAEDIGPELIPFLKPEDLLKRMNAEKQRQLISMLNPKEILADMSAEDRLRLVKVELEDLLKRKDLELLLAEMNPDSRNKLFEMLSKAQVSTSTSHQEKNGNGV